MADATPTTPAGEVSPAQPAGPAAVSLRRRWNRAVAVIVVLFVVGSVANFLGTRSSVASFRAVAIRTEDEARALAQLRSAVVSQALLRSAAVQDFGVDKRQLDAAATAERASFELALGVLRPGAGREIIERHRAASEALWPQDITTLSPPEFLARTSRGRENFAMLDEAALASQAQARRDLAAAADFERQLAVATALASVLLVALVLRFARRLSREVLGPVAELRDSANRLASGDLDHRVAVHGADEIGELARTFNTMAGVVAGGYRDLTLQASQDALTGLANRSAFHSRLQAALSAPDRRHGRQAVVFIDLDDFKVVNDELGHAAGDEGLCITAARLTEAVRPGDLVARLGGDEFALLLDGVEDSGTALEIAQRAVDALSVEATVCGTRVKVGASAGLALGRRDSDAASLMRQADMAMYAAKRQGKNRVERYHVRLDERPEVAAAPPASVAPGYGLGHPGRSAAIDELGSGPAPAPAR